MTVEADELDPVARLISRYVAAARADLESRRSSWRVDIASPAMDQVLGALLARQVTLATQLAQSPGVWNQHVAPLVFRAMADLHITAAWILKDPESRARSFLLHGLGQDKLYIEHRKNEIAQSGGSPEDDEQLSLLEGWVNEQQYTYLTEVNVGSWSGVDTRAMADEVGLLGFYRLAYAPWSATTHSMWNHVGKYNVTRCRNPLHRFHRVPIDWQMPPDPNCLHQVAELLQQTLDLFDSHRGGSFLGPSALSVLEREMNALAREDESKPPEPSPAG